MNFEKKDNEGTLWKEGKKLMSQKTGREYTSYSGDCKIDGKEYWINAFLNTVKAQEGDKELYRMTFKLKEQKKTEGTF